MKAKKLISIAVAAAMAAVSVISVSAVTLTDTDPSGETEVIAHIDGANPGDVKYMIDIPDLIDFGNLTIPPDDESDYDADQPYELKAILIDGLDTTKQAVAVYVKDQNATPESRDFYIANKENAAVKFTYDVYRDATTLNETTRVNNGDFFTKGYYLTSFQTVGQVMVGKLIFHQKQLYGQNIADIAGDYSGYMVFFSAIENF